MSTHDLVALSVYAVFNANESPTCSERLQNVKSSTKLISGQVKSKRLSLKIQAVGTVYQCPAVCSNLSL